MSKLRNDATHCVCVLLSLSLLAPEECARGLKFMIESVTAAVSHCQASFLSFTAPERGQCARAAAFALPLVGIQFHSYQSPRASPRRTMTGSACTEGSLRSKMGECIAAQQSSGAERATEIHAAFLLTPNLVGRKMRQQLNIFYWFLAFDDRFRVGEMPLAYKLEKKFICIDLERQF
jgi:hypothetical protein